MMRIRMDKLSQQDGVLFYRGSPFSGIAYTLEGNRVVGNIRVREGKAGPPAETWEKGVLRVTRESLVEIGWNETSEQYPTPGAFLDGAPFHGVAYEFDRDSGCLLSENIYEGEGATRGREWYPSGQMRAENGRVGPDGYESEGWYENGQQEFLDTATLSLSYTEQGRLTALDLCPGYSPSLLGESPFVVGDHLLLSGSGIDDQMIRRLVGLESLTRLHLRGTNLTGDGIQVFRSCRNLEAIDTAENLQLGAKDIQRLLSNLPSCEWIDRDTLLKRLEEESQ